MAGKVDVERFIVFSKPFIDAMKKVFMTMVFNEINHMSPKLVTPGEKAHGDISVVMGLNGSVKVNSGQRPFVGMMVISFSTETYVKIASAMLSSEYTVYNEEIKDVGAEISNITTGNAKKVLREMGYLISMSVPTTVVGAGHEINYPNNTETVMIPFDSALGKFVMVLCYQDTNEV